jgi:hypothetical protein
MIFENKPKVDISVKKRILKSPGCRIGKEERESSPALSKIGFIALRRNFIKGLGRPSRERRKNGSISAFSGWSGEDKKR